MKRLRRLLISLMITALMAAGMPMTAFAKPDWPSDTGIESEAGIVMDADSGAVLFGQNIHVQKAPASITKILTALVVIENSSLDDTITFSHDAVYNVEDGSGNKNSIEEGDTPEILQKRVMEQAEWKLLPQAVSLFCQDRLSVEGRIVHIAEK